MGKWFADQSVTDGSDSLWQSQIKNIDLREEFANLVYGQGSTAGTGQYMLQRVMSRSKERCPCWDQNRGSSSNCKYCKGETYKWTEVWVRGWFTQTYGRSLTAATQVNTLLPPGIFDHDKAIMYLPSDVEIATHDAVFRIRLNVDGKPYYPVERIEKWRAVNVEDRRQENGELAFWLVLCERVEF